MLSQDASTGRQRPDPAGHEWLAAQRRELGLKLLPCMKMPER